MKNYWLRIGLGALAVFGVGMILVTLVRKGESRVRTVVNSTDPITIPLAFIPFSLGGQRLGTLKEVVLERSSPHRVNQVRLRVKLDDSASAARLAGCRLAADFDWDKSPQGVSVSHQRYEKGTFRCIKGDASHYLVKYGTVTLDPPGLSVPLLIPSDVADDLRKGDFNDAAADSAAAIAETRADSLSEAFDARADSLEQMGESLAQRVEEQSQVRADSIRRAVARTLDSLRARR